jgi:hypothetical protein
MPYPSSPLDWSKVGRIVYSVGSNVIRRAMQIQLTENQSWYGEIIDCQGYSLFGMFVYNHTGSPGALSVVYMQFSPNPDFSTPPANAYQSLSSPSPGGAYAVTQPYVIHGRYARPWIRTGSTAGTYTISVYWTFLP